MPSGEPNRKCNTHLFATHPLRDGWLRMSQPLFEHRENLPLPSMLPPRTCITVEREGPGPESQSFQNWRTWPCLLHGLQTLCPTVWQTPQLGPLLGDRPASWCSTTSIFHLVGFLWWSMRPYKGPGRQQALKNHQLLLLCSSPIITKSIQSRYYYPYSTNEGKGHNIIGASMILMIVFQILIFKINFKK